ncbi:MAG: aminotransferase class I/II-fold pyridoxal phosphate-dependent enzyme [Clostridium sp.]|uniref:DegT/DnrJ/EryC1/StrS family aminotransferase n=1 Tax=Clostridium sp. TaxID=1506 RepID=UPI003053BD91
MGKEEMKYIQEAFDTNWIAPLGPNVENFEKEMASYVGVDGGLALVSGTAAIHMALKLLGVEPGDLVFCSSLTFVASCNPIIYEGAKPVFIDSEEQSLNMSPKALERAFQYYKERELKPKAVIVVHLYGQSADMDKILEICNRYKVPVIEDAAESLGATYKGKQTGTMGDFGVFSFNGNKIITTSGGGMLVSNHIKGLQKAQFWATQARDEARHYQHSELGYNYRMSNVIAGIGRGQLKVLSGRIAKKKSIYEKYKKAFKNIRNIEMEDICSYGKSNHWLSVITLDKKSAVKPIDIIIALEEENIESRPIWKPIHLQPYYERYKFFSHNDIGLSVSEDVFQRGVCLPSDTNMTEKEQEKVIKIIKDLF